jgi:hypothetical protein
MVLKYPGAAWDPLGVQTEPMMKAHDILCFHTMVGSLAGTSRMFHENGYGGTESTWGVGESKAQGIEQWQDAMRQADANYQGNPRVSSIETADYGGVFGKWNTNDASQVPAWTSDQLDMLVGLTVWWCKPSTHANCPSTWACHKSGIPCTLIPDTRPGRRGIGFHRQGCKPNVVIGGEVWSLAYGKICPGSKRENQLKTIIIPRAAKILAGGSAVVTPPVPAGDDMSDADVQKINNYSQLMAVANNNFTRQVVSAATKAIILEINEVDEETAQAVADKLDSRFQSLSDQMIADAHQEATAAAAAPEAGTETTP